MNILIITRIDDGHAQALKWALSHYGAYADTLFESDFPQRGTITYSSDTNTVTVDGPELRASSWDVVWCRRSSEWVAHDSIHPEDRKVAKRCGSLMLHALRYALGDRAFWANGPESGPRAENKVRQLQIAKQVGLNIPHTLISTDPYKVRAFVGRFGTCIVKPLTTLNWKGPGYTTILPTTRIRLSDLQDDVAIQACPMIYQQEVKKNCEYRVMVMGREIVAVELDTQSVPQARLDWRWAKPSTMNARRVNLEDDVELKLLRFMDEADLVCGSFDLARTEAGEIVFFEVNQQGQFLWLETVVPSLPMLDIFARFLISGDKNFRDAGSKPVVTLEGFHDSGEWEKFKTEYPSLHVTPPNAHVRKVYEDVVEEVPAVAACLV